MDKSNAANIPAETLAECAGLSRAYALDPDLMEAAVKRGLQPLSPLAPAYAAITEPALGFKARG